MFWQVKVSHLGSCHLYWGSHLDRVYCTVFLSLHCRTDFSYTEYSLAALRFPCDSAKLMTLSLKSVVYDFLLDFSGTIVTESELIIYPC